MKTTQQILEKSREFLEGKGIPNARRIAEELLSKALSLSRLQLYTLFDRPVNEQELDCLRKWLKRLINEEPIEYILGSIDFFGCKIKVDPRALIPRQETEILVEKISKQNPQGVLWDVCCGSGAIGIALKKAFPTLDVVLSDISEEALSLARENAKLNGVEITFVHGDLLEPFEGKKADWIVCNPPYISERAYASLQTSVKAFEPKIALVGGNKGFEFYERFQNVREYLKEEGQLFFEIGYDQKEALLKLFPEGAVENDLSNHARFFRLKNHK